jgi:S1-C subfamily serine protease
MAMYPQGASPSPPAPSRSVTWLLLLLIVLTAAGGYVLIEMNNRLDAITRQLTHSRKQLGTTMSQVRGDERNLAALQADVAGVQTGLKHEKAQTLNVTKLAESLAPSVFTVYTDIAQGTGFAIAADGGATYVATNWHVVEDAGATGSVTLEQGTDQWSGRVYSHDAQHDLALVRVAATVTPLPIASPDRHPVVVGEPVLAYGSPYGLTDTATQGIISAIRGDLIQTDAAINHGNSGGPLVDRFGDVVGITSYGIGGQGLGLAIDVRLLCDQLLTSSSCG